ncbi:MAG: PD-(D/E)XK nuclease family protein, partial [Anaerolineae bacterium]
AVYHLPLAADEDAVLAAGVAQARGIGFRAVAVLGLAEGEFPSALSEDPFLRDADRRHLAEDFGLPIDRSPENLEAQIFYEAITRPREALLLTRPRIADNGAPWEPSPYWEEVSRRVAITPIESTGRSHPPLGEAASWPELAAAVAAHSAVGVPTTAAEGPEATPAWAWVAQHQPALCDQITHGSMPLAHRLAGIAGPLDGDLTGWAPVFSAHFSPRHVWSASRLEQYRTCPYFFFTSSVLGLEPRQPPREGLDARQLGNIYHHILEQLYRTVGRAGDLAALLEALPGIANGVLDAAPRAEQFRETAFWERTRQGILAHVEQSVRGIEALGGGYRFSEAERAFGISGREGAALVVYDGDDSFSVHGLIDRVDRDDAGRVRIVDYKTAGPWSFTNAAVRDGKKLQLPLYALAAQEALELGQVTEGVYWHVQHAEPSGFTLSGFYMDDQRGPRAAMAHVVAMAWEAVRGARAGAFVPKAPKGGCPSYCPAAAYCWHYEASSW